MERLQTIALESVEQCKRRSVPEILHIDNPVSILTGQCSVFFDFVEEVTMPKKTADQSYVGIIGPEGHFDEEEIQRFSDAGASSCNLGTHILRTETAAIIAGWHLVQQSI
jgi:16S rRNA (uracil1498-N3)-methyltransferase